MDRAQRLADKLADNEGVLISGRANIFYYSGFASEDAFLYIAKDKRVIVTDSRYTIQASQQADGYEVFSGKLGKLLSIVSESYIWFEDECLPFSQYAAISAGTADKSFVPKQSEISEMRRIKDDDEIRRIAAAEELGDRAFSHILEFIKPGMTEKEIALELEMFMRKCGAERTSFETICASGARSAMPHGTASDKTVEKGDLLTLDFGCVLDGYCSDMTRTISIGGMDDRQTEIYSVVRNAQNAALTKICAGRQCSEIDAFARNVIADGGYGECFGHSLGHSVGIEIHESPNLSPRSEDILHAGNVVSVEPGIYIEGFGGVRIEDLVVVLEDGCRNLTSSDKNIIIV